MDASSLMQKLAALERALAQRGDTVLLAMIRESQDAACRLEQENEELALQNAGLRQCLRGGHGFPLPPFAFSPTAAFEDPDFCGSQLCESLAGEENSRLWRTTHFFTF